MSEVIMACYNLVPQQVPLAHRTCAEAAAAAHAVGQQLRGQEPASQLQPMPPLSSTPTQAPAQPGPAHAPCPNHLSDQPPSHPSQLQGSSQHHPALPALLHLPGLSILTRPATNPMTSPAVEQQPIIAQSLALAYMATATARRASTLSKASDSPGHRASRLAAAAKALFKYKRGFARPSVRAVAKQHGVPRSTLNEIVKRGGRVATRGRPTALTEAEELQLAGIVKGAQAQGRGVTRLDLLGAVQRACEARVRKGLPHPFPNATPSRKWFSAFMSRHGLSLRKASPQTKARRAAAESQEALSNWYDNQLMPALQKRCNSRQTYKERPDRVFNADETGFQPYSNERVPLKRAFAKTGLYPPSKDQLLAAAKASIQSGKGKVTLAPWKRLVVSNDMMEAAIQRSAEEQPALYFRAVDPFYNRQELEEQVYMRAAKRGRGAHMLQLQPDADGSVMLTVRQYGKPSSAVGSRPAPAAGKAKVELLCMRVSLSNVVGMLNKQMPEYIRHHRLAHHQLQVFREHREAVKAGQDGMVVISCDWSKKLTVERSVEIMSEHWHAQQIGILVACAYFKNKEGAYKEHTVYVMTDGKCM
ncbi:hypothetical protein QJQ45_007855 [Haematococcus lacustris]|nr:hypothetical protein QJQ45_007855 [Haematococcus lacustris]